MFVLDLSVLESLDGTVTVTITVVEGGFHSRVCRAGSKD